MLIPQSVATSTKVTLSGFSDEAAWDKTVDQQFSAMAALGLRFTSLRFIDMGHGIKNMMQLDDAEVDACVKKLAQYGLSVATLGSPIGKVKLLDEEDGTKNRYVPFAKYLAEDVTHACRLANRLGTRLIRGFSFYHPKGSDPEQHLPQVIDQLGQIADVCAQHGLVYGLEVEANLVGQTGFWMARLYQGVGRDNLLLIFDAANLSTQGYSGQQVYEHYLAMKPGLGWLHIKDYKHPGPVKRLEHVDEEALKHFVPADQGDSGHELVLRDLAHYLPTIRERLAKFSVADVFLDLEPHVRGGGQFGGFSGPDGFGIALRGLCRGLDYAGIDYSFREYADLK
ncbi:MAG: sugar phosphate isomerase/epimerase [Planctomycetaceae bacterium]|jgi:sugar phosphate isomerase/epimerase|nr:sugar phosphate isomerase/epimerase [Planctomycetaceae bacterium]